MQYRMAQAPAAETSSHLDYTGRAEARKDLGWNDAPEPVPRAEFESFSGPKPPRHMLTVSILLPIAPFIARTLPHISN